MRYSPPGWRGLAAGVLESTIDAMPCRADQLLAWLGPAIGPQAYEVGPEVRAAFITRDPQSNVAFELSRKEGPADTSATPRWLANLYELARRRLRASGVTEVYGGDFCTLNDPARFFSYRRDGVTGRMASGIWLTAD
jgi:copper oxidase (laccase) domain-containing protein